MRFLRTFFWLMIGTVPAVHAQFREEFDVSTPDFRTQGIPGWNAVTGDGQGIFTQRIKDGSAILRLDGRPDHRNIWYAFIHQNIDGRINARPLNQPGYGLRISARVKTSHAPRRMNLYLKSMASGQDFLREFDLAEANKWYDLSMTTDDFRHQPGKPLLAQISFMDWGNTDVYELTADYLRVDVVDRSQAGPDRGLPLPYRPPLADPKSFALELPVAADAVIDRQHPDVVVTNLIQEGQSAGPLLLIDGTRWTVLRWNLADWRGRRVKGSGQLEFYTEAVYRLAHNPKDFGEVRLCEIQNTSPDWRSDSLTYARLLNGRPESQIINEQTIVDVAVTPGGGAKTTITLLQPVLQRLLDGHTTGIVLKPLGLISAFLRSAGPEKGRWAARLRFNVE